MSPADEDQIRALLASVPASGWIDRTPDTVAILRSRVEEAGGDHEAVSKWVIAQGGRLDRTPAFYRKSPGPRFQSQQEGGAKEFYVVPTAALAS